MPSLISGARRLDLAQLHERAARVGAGFFALGIRPGDAVALLMRNDFAFFEASLGASHIGAFPVLANWHFTAEELRYILEDSGARLLVAHADLLAPVRHILPPDLPVFVVDVPPEIAAAYKIPPELAAPAPGDRPWNAWLEVHQPIPAVTDAQLTPIIYTSGTTGRPKGVKRIARNAEEGRALTQLTARMFGLEAAIFGNSGERVATIVSGPMYHGGPNAAARLNMLAGADVVLQAKFDPEDLLRLIEAHRVTHLYMVPTMFVRLLRLPDEAKRRYDLSSLKWVIHTAAPCPPDVKRAMIDWWGPVINEYYAATETCATAFISAADWLAHPGSVGRVPDGVEVALLDDDGNEVPQGTPGEIFVRAAGIPDFTYHNDPGKRRGAERRGMVSVGDVGYFDPDGYLYLCDRKSQMVISGGVNIYPAEIEAELMKLTGVADAAVFGIPDAEYGEALAAHIQPLPGATLDEAEIKTALAQSLARYKIPRLIVFEPQLPREDSGKIFKRKLREPYWRDAGRRI